MPRSHIMYLVLSPLSSGNKCVIAEVMKSMSFGTYISTYPWVMISVGLTVEIERCWRRRGSWVPELGLAQMQEVWITHYLVILKESGKCVVRYDNDSRRVVSEW
ncbi:hypothetical protein BGX38DRAFT_1306611 [Terfezia claveryi]|nr:hypothetical protein BGX38DRAFT_1306611 [Terfezia claveryi]